MRIPPRRDLRPYLPEDLVRRGARAERFDAALLVADISGFTALTERLQRRGREGAEIVATTVGSFFRPAIGAIRRNGGSTASFGGDALLAVFRGASAVSRAVAASRGVARALEAADSPEPLSLAQVIHHGRVHGVPLQAPGERRRVHLMAGPALATLARLEESGRPGELILSSSAELQLRREEATVPDEAPRATELQLPRDLSGFVDPRLLPILGRQEGEFRRLAVSFVETRGSSRAALGAFFARLVRQLALLEGVLMKAEATAEGIRWMCAFGIPRAHEDDAERAARAAWTLVREPPRGLSVRASVHCGVTVVLEVGAPRRRSFEVMGDAVNTAARVMARARWGEALLTGDARASASRVATAYRGAHALKGKSARVRIHAVSGLRREQARASCERARAISPLVGRRRELESLARLLESARGGKGSVVEIQGGAGLGKSRLCHELVNLAGRRGFQVVEARASAHGGGSDEIGRELVGQALGIERDAPRERIRRAARAAARRLGLSDRDAAHLSELLGVPEEEIRRLPRIAARLGRRSAVRSLFLARARAAPQVVVLEDLHLAGEASLRIPATLGSLAGETAMLVVATTRRPAVLPGARAVELRPLEEAAVERLVLSLTGRAAGPVTRLVLEKSSGNPLFVEEVVRQLFATGVLARRRGAVRLTAAVALDEIPSTLDALVRARIDACSPDARRALEVGAVLGSAFPSALLGAVERGIPDAAVRELVAGGLWGERTEGRAAWSYFPQTLVRDVAYASILVARRRELHRRAARTIEESRRGRGPVLKGAALSGAEALLGHHYEQAGRFREARRRYAAGGRAATRRHAYEEAVRLFSSALRVSSDAPGRGSRPSWQELLGLRSGLIRSYSQLGRYREALVEVRRMVRASRLHGDRSAEALALGRLASFRLAIEGSRGARPFVRRAMAAARRVGRPELAARTLAAYATARFTEGHLEEALGLYRRAARSAAHDRSLAAMTLSSTALVLRELGRIDAAIACFERALAYGGGGDEIERMASLRNLAGAHLYRCEMERAVRGLEQSRRLAQRIGIPHDEAFSIHDLAEVASCRGDHESALARYDDAERRFRIADDALSALSCTLNRATLLGEMGRGAEALRLLGPASREARRWQSPRAEGRVQLIRAQIAAARGDVAEARRELERARASFRAARDEIMGQEVDLVAARLDAGEGRAASALATCDRILEELTARRVLVRMPEVLLLRARVLRQSSDPRGARTDLAACRRIARRLGNGLLLARCLCELGWLAGAGAERARLLGQARALVREARVGPRSPAALAATELGRARGR